MPERLLMRHPFPGPGLAVRILGDVTADRIDLLQQADKIYIDMLLEDNLYGEVWQAWLAEFFRSAESGALLVVRVHPPGYEAVLQAFSPGVHGSP